MSPLLFPPNYIMTIKRQESLNCDAVTMNQTHYIFLQTYSFIFKLFKSAEVTIMCFNSTMIFYTALLQTFYKHFFFFDKYNSFFGRNTSTTTDQFLRPRYASHSIAFEKIDSISTSKKKIIYC